jgi:WD40 repeat protein
MGFQAAAEQKEAGTQSQWVVKVNKGTQYAPVDMEAEEAQAILESEEMALFLREVEQRCTAILQDNETLDLFKDEFAEFEDEEASLGNRAENNLKETHSFQDLIHSKNKTISGVQWHPSKPGVVAFSCTNNETFNAWVDTSGKCQTSCVLVWNFLDLLHPELILEVPGNLLCFKINPHNPHLIVGGLATGQVIFWDLTAAYEAKEKAHEEHIKAGGEHSTGIESIKVEPTLLSVLSLSHTRAVQDIAWLAQTAEMNHRGKMSEDVAVREQTHTNQFLTVAGDGNIVFWDIRAHHWKNPQQISKERQENAKMAKWLPLHLSPLTRPDATTTLPATKVHTHTHTHTHTHARAHTHTYLHSHSHSLSLTHTHTHTHTHTKVCLLEDTVLIACTEDGEVKHPCKTNHSFCHTCCDLIN